MTNKNKEHCEVGCDSKNFPRGRSPHSSSSLSYLTCVVQPSCLIPLCVQVGPGRGQLVSRQCFSLDRGVCTLTSLKIPEDRFRTRVSDRLPWKDSGQTSQNKTVRKVQQHYGTHTTLSLFRMYNRKRGPYTKEEGNLILNRVKNQLTLEQAERTRKRVEELNNSARTEPQASTNTSTHPERDTQLPTHSSSSTEERRALLEDLQLPS